jgi:hypothetical protein
MTIATMHWRTTWSNGDPTYWITFTDISGDQQEVIERTADEMGFQRDGGRWEPPGDMGTFSFFEAARAEGVKIDFEEQDRDAPFDLQRLKLHHATRLRLENLGAFVLFELAGYCPVQSSGVIDQSYWYFRARGSYWRFEAGGNEIGTKGPTWWYEEEWPGKTGFEAGYMSDQDAISNILKAVKKYRSDDMGPYTKGHPDYERTTLEGWALGALTLRRAGKRLSISGEEAIQRATDYGIALPYLADRELESLGKPNSRIWGYNRATGEWVEIVDEDE